MSTPIATAFDLGEIRPPRPRRPVEDVPMTISFQTFAEAVHWAKHAAKRLRGHRSVEIIRQGAYVGIKS